MDSTPLRVLGLVLAAWLAIYATHTLHLLPGPEHAMPAIGDVAPVAAFIEGSFGHLLDCAVEASSPETDGSLLVTAAVFLVAVSSGAKGAILLTSAQCAQAGPRQRRAALQVFRN